jgi:hypothetical protein
VVQQTASIILLNREKLPFLEVLTHFNKAKLLQSHAGDVIHPSPPMVVDNVATPLSLLSLSAIFPLSLFVS